MRRLAALLLALGCSPPSEQQDDYNALKGTVYALEHRSPATDRVLPGRCEDYQAQAVNYRKIRAWRINALVDRYMAGCAELVAPRKMKPPKGM